MTKHLSLLLAATLLTTPLAMPAHADGPVDVVVPTRLVVRSSTGPPPTG